jgi:hypothetical protein
MEERKYNYGYEGGQNIRQTLNRLLKNQDFCKLIKYTSPDPLNEPNIVDTKVLLNHNLLVVPKADPQYNMQPRVVLMFTDGTIQANSSYQGLLLQVYIYIPLEQWEIRDDNLRPFAIMYEVKKTLMGKHIEGIGTITGGNFHLDFVTDEISCHILSFTFNVNS